MNDKEQPSYYAIIPATIRYDKRLRFAERLIYGEITALLGKEGYCFATNQYFANLYNVTNGTISTWISHLNKLGYIKEEIIRDVNKQVIERRIYITDDTCKAKVQDTYTSKKGYPYTLKNAYPITQKDKDNNINIRIDNLFNYIIKKEGQIPEELSNKEFLEYYQVIERLEFNYTEEWIKMLNAENTEKLKIILFCIKDIFKSNKKILLSRSTREDFINVYDKCRNFEKQHKETEQAIYNFYDYYYTSVIRKLES